MKAIDKIIFNELASRRAVVLPGFGTLGVVRRPAEITGREVMPPENQVVYSKEEAGDAPSVIMLMEAMGVSHQAAGDAYTEWLCEASKDDETRIEGVGTITRGVFTPSPELAQMLNPMHHHGANDESASYAAARTDECGGDGERRRCRCLPNILLAIAILLLLIIGWLCLRHCGGLCGKGVCGTRTEAVELPQPAAEDADGADGIAAGQETGDGQVGGQQAGGQIGGQAGGQQAAQTAKRYHLIAGSFIYDANADEMVRRYKSQFPELTVEKIVTLAWVMVSVYQGDDENEVADANRRLSGQLGNNEMWVYRKR